MKMTFPLFAGGKYSTMVLVPVLLILIGLSPALASNAPFKESNGVVIIEAEHYHSTSNPNNTDRDFYKFPRSSSSPKPDYDDYHSGAANNQYLEILPDTRASENDKKINNVNFFKTGNKAPRLNYKVRISNGGKYYVWARAYPSSSGKKVGEDNSIHAGVDGNFPSSGKAIQFSGKKNEWKWSGECREGGRAYLNLDKGDHTIMFAMREDGFEFDRFILVKAKSYKPSGKGNSESGRAGSSSDDDDDDKTTETDTDTDTSADTDTDTSADTDTDTSADTDTDTSADTDTDTSADTDTDTSADTDTDTDSVSAENDGDLIVIEAEDYDDNIQTTSHYWLEVSSPGSYSGQGAMKASPDNGTNAKNNYSTDSPNLRYSINFENTGTYYIWVRGYAYDKGNSLHAGLNGEEVTSSKEISLQAKAAWSWSNASASGAAYLQVENSGTQYVDIWMREDGLILDKIVLTTDSSYTPTGTGPTADETENIAEGTSDDEEGLLSIEVESFDSSSTAGQHGWQLSTSPNGYSGDGAMGALPDTGKNVKNNYAQNSPSLTFNFNFTQTGTYYVWLRGYAKDKGNSVHVGLNSQQVSTCSNISFDQKDQWAWTGSLDDGSMASLNIPQTGAQTVQIWMREDGLVLDKLVLTIDPQYVPSGLGPQ